MRELQTPRVPFAPGDDIAAIVQRIASRDPNRIALIEGHRRLSWGALADGMSRVCAALLELGLHKGARVAVLSRNSIEYVEVFLGTLRAGCCIVPLPTMASSETLQLMLTDSASSVLFASSEYRTLVESFSPSPSGKGRIGLDFSDSGWTGYEAWKSAATERPAVAVEGEDEFDIIYSSGTTGIPKGISHTHAARKASYAGSRVRYFDRDSINVVSTPFYSNTTCVTWLLTTAAGGTNVIMRRFDAERFVEVVAEHGGTHAMLVPVQYDRILRSPRFDAAGLSSMRHKFSTSAPLSANLKREILARFPGALTEIYGTTEGGVVTLLSAHDHPDKLASVGRPSPACEIKVVDETGAELPAGHAGEVVGRSPNMMRGYVNRPEETESIVWQDSDGRTFFRSGDIGRFDEDGFLYLLDRKKDVIISGGLNIYATDLEQVLSKHEAVAEAAVVGVPSEKWGETPLALVVLEPGACASTEELLEWCNSRVGKSHRLSALELRDALPKNAIGKTLKRQLRQPYWQEASK